MLQRLGQPQDALETFQDLLKLQPDDADTLFSIGAILQSLGRMRDALAAYEDALRRRPDHCEALTNRGALLERFGRFEESLACFEAIVALKPGDGGALFNKGSVLQKLGRNEDALAAYEEAARAGPIDAETELDRGNVLQKLGRLDEALVCYDRSSCCRDGYPQALYNKGIALQALGRPIEALQAYDNALAFDPRYCEAVCNRGNVLHELGRLDEAFAAYADALKIRPGFVPALTNRANIFLQWGRADQALRCCDEALRHDARHPQALGMRGAALQKLGRLDEALISLDRALELNRFAPEVWLNRGNVLRETDRLLEAVASYNQALRVRPNYPEALSSLGVALKESGQIDQAIACFNEALAHKPSYPDARNNRAGALLLKGMLRQGFEDFESRWERSNAPPRKLVPGAARWSGEDLKGRSILVWDEQGLGDLIQFSRYQHPCRSSKAKPTSRCSAARTCRSGCARCRAGCVSPTRSPIAKASISRALCLVFPARSGRRSRPRYKADALPRWHQKRTPPPNGRRGSARTDFADRRLLAWPRLGQSEEDHSPQLVSRRRGDRRCPPHQSRQESIADRFRVALKVLFRLEISGEEFDAGPDSFIDCAAAMAALDLVITSDTAIAHLAGALGRPVFVALKQASDWRWLLARLDSPWYPTARLFRQAERDEWGPVFDTIAGEVEARVLSRSQADHMRADPAAPPMVGAPVGEATPIAIPGAIGELIDKITILEIRRAASTMPVKLRNIRYELSRCYDG